jgi:hypothetical protein
MTKLMMLLTLSAVLTLVSGCCCQRRGAACPTCGPAPVYSTPVAPGPDVYVPGPGGY